VDGSPGVGGRVRLPALARVPKASGLVAGLIIPMGLMGLAAVGLAAMVSTTLDMISREDNVSKISTTAFVPGRRHRKSSTTLLQPPRGDIALRLEVTHSFPTGHGAAQLADPLQATRGGAGGISSSSSHRRAPSLKES
jgi:hypothetical protein